MKRRFLGVAGSAALSASIFSAFAAPIAPSQADMVAAYIDVHAQTLSVSYFAPIADITRRPYSATPGTKTLVDGGTNYDWAKLVLLDGGWPITDANVTVLLRWMRQENGADNWWNRNNPLNNGYGSGGGGGTGHYANLQVAAQKAAENLQRNGGFNGIEANFAASSPTSATEAAIWASPWATGHYANGGHWHYTTVPQVKAPTAAWG